MYSNKGLKKEVIETSKHKEKVEIAKELKSRGTTNEDVSGITGLFIEEIKSEEKLKASALQNV